MGFGKIIGRVFASVFGKKTIGKMVSSKLNKAPIIKVGLFDLKNAKAGRNVVKDFIDQAGHTDVNLADLNKLKA